MKNKLIHVICHGRRVGRIAMADPYTCAFEYDGDWLAHGFSISPFRLPLEKRVFIAPRDPFGGSFGVFEDSLPDGWGRLLTDRMLLKKGINPAEVSVPDRLAIVGTSGMGALEYEPEESLVTTAANSDINVLASEVEAILKEREYSDRSLADLVKLGGSSGGARPKVLLKIDGEDWIVKFRASSDPPNIGEQEYEYARKARAAGLDMPPARLFEGQFFGVKRFDRRGEEKIFMLSASGLLDASHRFPSLDYVDLLNATLHLTRDYGEVEKMFRLMCFNVCAHNRDDHAKNFAFLYDGGRWRASPVYDLVYAEGMGGEHATTIDGEGKNPTDKDILRVAQKIGMPDRRAKTLMGEIREAMLPPDRDFPDRIPGSTVPRPR
ncbi:MAG: type II toxin-antitoxin system HipA family toxin [Synergistaceae bacterium]|jgi:serine/threonine-protein kinase HipA|nr:type II toxin-antitoxin system HipA family toxin [Synergistaceae bacterium]